MTASEVGCTQPHLAHFPSLPPSGPVPPECFIPSYCHISSKKASLLCTANAVNSLLGAHVFHPSITREWIKMLVLAESHTQAEPVNSTMLRENNRTKCSWPSVQRPPAPHLCLLILPSETVAVKGSCDHGGHRGKGRKGGSAGLTGPRLMRRGGWARRVDWEEQAGLKGSYSISTPLTGAGIGADITSLYTPSFASLRGRRLWKYVFVSLFQGLSLLLYLIIT